MLKCLPRSLNPPEVSLIHVCPECWHHGQRLICGDSFDSAMLHLLLAQVCLRWLGDPGCVQCSCFTRTKLGRLTLLPQGWHRRTEIATDSHLCCHRANLYVARMYLWTQKLSQPVIFHFVPCVLVVTVRAECWTFMHKVGDILTRLFCHINHDIWLWNCF